MAGCVVLRSPLDARTWAWEDAEWGLSLRLRAEELGEALLTVAPGIVGGRAEVGRRSWEVGRR